jgi:hypothetical protein
MGSKKEDLKNGGWDDRKEDAARMIFEGAKTKDVAFIIGVSERQIYRWKNEENFFRRTNDFVSETQAMLYIHRAMRELDKRGGRVGDVIFLFKMAAKVTEKIDYSDPRYGIPPEQLYNWPTKNTVKSVIAKMKRQKKKAAR